MEPSNNKKPNFLILIAIIFIFLIVVFIFWRISEKKKEQFKFGEINVLDVGDIDTRDFNICKNEEYKFEFKYPKEWSMEKEGVFNPPQTLISTTVDGKEVNKMGPKYDYTDRKIYHWGQNQNADTEIHDGAVLTVWIALNKERFTLREWVQKEKEVYQTFHYNVDEEELLINNYFTIKLTIKPEGELNQKTENLGETVYVNEKYLFEKEGKIYKVSFFAVSPNNNEKYKEAFEKMLSTFRFLD